jgi:hypothetical protein
MKSAVAIGLLLAAAYPTAFAADPPEAEISNNIVRARVAIPDVQNGYYRGTRFDWSGVIPSLEYGGHTYFGQRTPRTDPTAQGSTSGPVEDFTTDPGGSGLNYGDAKPGETFVKIGVGVLRKPDEPKYDFKTNYEILDNGKWTVRTGPDWVETTQELTDPKSGYAYVYRKTVRLASGKPQMVIEHNLKNTGRKTISTPVLNHNFFYIDQQPVGPDFTVTFPFPVKAEREMPGAEVRGNQVVFLKPLETGQASTNLTGYSNTAKDFDFRVENHKTGAGVRLTADRPLTRFFFWSVPTTLCTEAYVSISVEPGKDVSWSLMYDFYVLPSEGPKKWH